MRVAVLIPVGPGHEKLSLKAVESVQGAWQIDQGPFDYLSIRLMPDPRGVHGRSQARNIMLDLAAAFDFQFLLDADDQMHRLAFALVDLQASATFGAVCLDGEISRDNVFPCSRTTLFQRGALGTLSMGCFLRGDLGLRFDETLDVGEDFDFYMRLPDFVKRPQPLVSIGYRQPSASGPRGYDRVDWIKACNAIIDRHRPAHAPQA